MATLSNPTFEVDFLTGMPSDARVIATVTVELTPFETFLVNAGLPLELQSSLWGEDDGNFDGGDDYLFSFPSQTITGAGTYTFNATVFRGVLNEDSSRFDNSDEVYNSFNLVSQTNLFPVSISANSPTIPGYF